MKLFSKINWTESKQKNKDKKSWKEKQNNNNKLLIKS